MFDVVVPKLNNNDDSYTLLDWLVEDGQQVRAGDPLVELETSKALAELSAEQDGIVHRLAVVSSQCRHGDVIARLYGSEADRQRTLASEPTTVDPGVVITNAALVRAGELGIPVERLHALGKKLVRREDVEGLAGAPDRVYHLPRTQAAIAAVVTTAHRTIPAASAVMKVHVDAALTAARQASKRAGMLIGLPELLIGALAGLRDRYPLFFAAPLTDDSLRLADSSHIGVTIDIGSGLFVPVIHNAERCSVVDIAETLLRFRTAATGPGFREADLSGMNLMLSLHTDPDLVLATPLIHPGTTCVVCLAGLQQEVVLSDSGAVTARRVVNIGITYDHRIINGRDAVLFLQAVKSALEDPEIA